MTYNKKMFEAYQGCRDLLHRVVAKIAPSSDVEDILQDAFIKGCHLDEEITVTKPRSLWVTIARNLAIDHIRKSEHRLVESVDQAEMEHLFESDTFQDDTLQRVVAREEFLMFCDIIRELPPQCRKAFLMRKVYGHSQKEIAQHMGLSESTVEKHIANGLRKCFQQMKAQKKGSPAKHGDKKSKVQQDDKYCDVTPTRIY